MSEVKPPDVVKHKRTRKFDKRSRSGCLTCKQRRVKCDEFHPRCKNCVRLKLNCNYGVKLLWEDEAIAKGISFGRSKQNKIIRQQSRRGNLLPNEKKQLTLTEMLRNNKNIKWVKSGTDSYNLFLNTTYEDFNKIFDMVTRDDLELKKYNMPHKNTNVIISVNDNAHTSNNITVSPASELVVNNHDIFMDLAEHAHGYDQMFESPSSSSSTSLIIGNPYGSNHSNNSHNPIEFSFNLDHFFCRTFTSTFNFFNDEFYKDNIKLESEIFNYFVNGICPGCVCYPKKSNGASGMIPAPVTQINPDLNPYLYLVVPLAQRSPIVYKTLVSVASRQLSLLGNSKFDTLSENYTSEVLKALPLLIKEKQMEKSNNWDEVLATVLMLCFADISSSCGASWLIHLNGAKEFLKVSSIRSNITPVAKFFIRYFVTHEVMGETAWFQNMIISDDEFLDGLKNDSDERIDLVLGCSPHLISIINQISKLGETYESFESKDRNSKGFMEIQAHILESRDRLESKLTNLNQYLKISELDDESHDNIIKISEIKRLTTLIYLFARIDLEYLHLNHNKPDNDNDAVLGVKYPKRYTDRLKAIKQVTKKIMGLIQTLPSVSMSLLWTLFIIGIVSVENEEERWFVLSRLIEMERIRELASVKIARQVVETVWKEKDLNCLSNRWKDMIKGKANTISLA
ncbi:hypothetical protein G9P44_004236 [Scheffersomyces stipitis]|nr:hypothetical protein G9P44_004236 [Scheffersomyces stipitis]